MKAGKKHRVPLTKEAVAVLKVQQEKSQSDCIFPGWNVGLPLSGAA